MDASVLSIKETILKGLNEKCLIFLCKIFISFVFHHSFADDIWKNISVNGHKVEKVTFIKPVWCPQCKYIVSILTDLKFHLFVIM